MKFTYLVYKQVNGTRQLAAATQEEWDAILKKNRRLPLEQRHSKTNFSKASFRL